jgi:hypothetical protein
MMQFCVCPFGPSEVTPHPSDPDRHHDHLVNVLTQLQEARAKILKYEARLASAQKQIATLEHDYSTVRQLLKKCAQNLYIVTRDQLEMQTRLRKIPLRYCRSEPSVISVQKDIQLDCAEHNGLYLESTGRCYTHEARRKLCWWRAWRYCYSQVIGGRTGLLAQPHSKATLIALNKHFNSTLVSFIGFKTPDVHQNNGRFYYPRHLNGTQIVPADELISDESEMWSPYQSTHTRSEPKNSCGKILFATVKSSEVGILSGGCYGSSDYDTSAICQF